MSGETRSINCTNCGAGLDVLGGGRVVTQVCSYCGAALDANDAYRVIEVFGNMPRPDSPFRLGMTGKLNGVDFTIIGTLGKSETYRGRTWTWVDHQLYSPTHGYAWLTVEDDHVVLTRKVRDWPQGSFLTSVQIARMDAPPTRRFRGTRFKYYATSNWRTDFVEGEFNWRPAKGAKGTTISTMSNGAVPQMLSYLETERPDGGSEREIELGTLWPEATDAFGAPPLHPRGVHPLQPYEAEKRFPFYTYWFGGVAAATLFAALFVMAGGPPAQVLYQGRLADAPSAIAVPIAQTARPAELRLDQPVLNSWASYQVTVNDPSGLPVADTFRAISYYTGVEGGERWTEGSRNTRLQFQPQATGAHQLILAVDEAGQPADSLPDIRIELRDGRMASGWLWATWALFLGVFVLSFAREKGGPARHRFARWRGGDWHED